VGELATIGRRRGDVAVVGAGNGSRGDVVGHLATIGADDEAEAT